MSCSSCHNPHGGRSRALIDATSINDKCYQCHFEKKAPVLWEHSPVKEDCLVCHTPHGSSNDKLLVSRIPRLCQDCHMQGRHQSGALCSSITGGLVGAPPGQRTTVDERGAKLLSPSAARASHLFILVG